MLALLGFATVVVVLAVVVYVVHKVSPKRVKLSAVLGKLVTLTLEADGNDPPRQPEASTTEHDRALP